MDVKKDKRMQAIWKAERQREHDERKPNPEDQLEDLLAQKVLARFSNNPEAIQKADEDYKAWDEARKQEHMNRDDE